MKLFQFTFIFLFFSIIVNAQTDTQVIIPTTSCGDVKVDYCASTFGNSFGFRDTGCNAVPDALESGTALHPVSLKPKEFPKVEAQ